MIVGHFLRGFTLRTLVIIGVAYSCLSILVFRLWYEQLRLGKSHRDAISNQSIRRIRLPPVRGRLIGNNGTLYTDNRPAYNAYFHIHELRQPGRHGADKTINVLYKTLYDTAKLIGRNHNISRKNLKRHLSVYPALPYKAFKDLTDHELAKLYEAMPGIPGLEIRIGIRRVYPQGPTGAHIIGFVGNRIPQKETEREHYSYFLPELTGRAGMERIFDETLRGAGGDKLVRVDSMGYFYEELDRSEITVPGDDVFLTLDGRAQAIAQSLLSGVKGALVLLEVDSGAIIAMVSSPTYNLQELSSKYYAELANDNDNFPLLNRCISGGNSPGSIIKPLIGLAILEENFMEHDDEYLCTGSYEIGNAKIRCSNLNGHGAVNLLSALETSCNTYFIHAGINLGISRLQQYFISAGIGEKTGIELESSGDTGILPGRQEKRNRLGQSWNAFDTALTSIGQGLITISPLQAALYTAAIANGGTLYKPTIVRAVKKDANSITNRLRPTIKKHLKASKSTIQVIQEGMIRVVYGRQATGSSARNSFIEIAGKTGTAEVGYGRNKSKNVWFTCYGPVQTPKYALTIFIEDGISGGYTAAPIAKKFFEEYLSPAPKSEMSSSNTTTIGPQFANMD